jgi:hypothetical protein
LEEIEYILVLSAWKLLTQVEMVRIKIKDKLLVYGLDSILLWTVFLSILKQSTSYTIITNKNILQKVW